MLAVIGTDGTVKDVRVESGPPLLAQAAIEAVKQWLYKPYLLNGVPVEIDSRIAPLPMGAVLQSRPLVFDKRNAM